MLTFFLLTVVLVFLFLVFIFVGIAKKRRKPVYISLVFFLLAIPAGLYTSFLVAQKTYQKIKSAKIENPLKRSGIDIYKAVLDEPTANCVTVLNSQDQYIPRIDCCIWLEFKTCPQEIARIINTKKLKPNLITQTITQGDSTNKETTVNDDIPDYSPKPEWFNLKNLGEGYQIMRKHSYDDPNHDLILYFSKDSTHAFYCDMAE